MVGLGGVGSFAECKRAGVGSMTIVDEVHLLILPNIEQTITSIAFIRWISSKVHVVGDRLMDINPELKLIRVQFLRQNEL